MAHSGRRIDHGVQYLIIPGGRKAEDLADRLLFRPGVTPELTFEVENCLVPLREGAGGGLV
ncbi:hypothetical protein HD599_000399 [Conyzicola lurida]|uniref:Uncharacterized protein n=1 Tax=Conyzicola lurida TaxID=1172621 RepID=A0A841AK26_9MICO|nr:hypothetical protein [Conyzicola lurida]